ncbi:hypothetical protein [Aquidulcibacter sp.]|jgi:hypothetical protein|uniref:hypothetical protein n=1 Tax=Aquidulcibacter sp. TaxID=2052990 RepID=UPI00078E5CE5|nr:hypothetical protein [Aquidulcibacter sp.]AMS29042.1 hypothetical protein AEM38_05480 [Hyphomonadaceae bacterium UKL13-1]MCE2891750.1 hypothetical protein [Hyphomonadaceae bacterium]MCZ8209663.1 hypothetical protein [Aquidulcibacter sp.]HCP63829.1 hypothetical protein [Hyphomonadaceae bacterium]
MTQPILEKFATQVEVEKLAIVRELARKEGRLLQSLVDEALTDLLEKRRRSQARASIMEAYQSSHETFAPLYKKLAE